MENAKSEFAIQQKNLNETIQTVKAEKQALATSQKTLEDQWEKLENTKQELESYRKALEAEKEALEEQKTALRNAMESTETTSEKPEMPRVTDEKEETTSKEEKSPAATTVSAAVHPHKLPEAEEEKPRKEPAEELREKRALQDELTNISRKQPYIRITSTDCCQFLFEARHLQIKAGLFDWGVEGTEIIQGEPQYIPHDAIARIEGLDSLFATDEIACDFSCQEGAAEAAELLLLAICCCQPMRITYRDKNGRISQKTLYYACFLPGEPNFTLPYPGMYRDMLGDEMDTDHIAARCAGYAEPRIFSINQIQAVQVFDAFFTTSEGVETIQEAIQLATECGQEEMADLLTNRLRETIGE